MRYELGMSAKSVSNPLTLEAVEAIGRSGIRTLETNPCNFTGADGDAVLAAFLEMTGRTGKGTPTYHCPYGTPWDLSSLDEEARRAAIGRLEGLFPQARLLHARILVEHPSWEPVPDAERPARLAALRRSMEELAPLLRKEGFRMALENLPRTCLGNTPEEHAGILEGFDETFGACLDVNHLGNRIADLPAAVRLLGKRLYCLHLSDYLGGDECHLLPGEGRIDWGAFLSALVETGYDGDFNYEVRLPGRSPAERCALVEDDFKSLMVPLFP